MKRAAFFLKPLFYARQSVLNVVRLQEDHRKRQKSVGDDKAPRKALVFSLMKLETSRPTALKILPPAINDSSISAAAGNQTLLVPRQTAARPNSMYIYSQSRSRRLNIGYFRRLLLPTIIGLLLLLLNAGIWTRSFVSNENGVAKTVTESLSSPSRIPSIIGVYEGTFAPINALPAGLKLIINQQKGSLFFGEFVLGKQNSTVSGTVDVEQYIAWTVVNSFGNAIFYFYGGLNGINGSQINTPDNIAGAFNTCIPGKGVQCIMPQGSDRGGFWSLSFVPAA